MHDLSFLGVKSVTVGTNSKTSNITDLVTDHNTTTCFRTSSNITKVEIIWLGPFEHIQVKLTTGLRPWKDLADPNNNSGVLAYSSAEGEGELCSWTSTDVNSIQSPVFVCGCKNANCEKVVMYFVKSSNQGDFTVCEMEF